MVHAYISGTCKNTDKGAKDSFGDGCDDYVGGEDWCGNYDDSDFEAKKMCCPCGGGESGKKWRKLINLFSISM